MNFSLCFLKECHAHAVNQKSYHRIDIPSVQDSRHQLPFRIRRIRKSADVMPRALVLAPLRPQHLHASGLWYQAEVLCHVLTCMIAYRSSQYQSPVFCLLHPALRNDRNLLACCLRTKVRACLISPGPPAFSEIPSTTVDEAQHAGRFLKIGQWRAEAFGG